MSQIQKQMTETQSLLDDGHSDTTTTTTTNTLLLTAAAAAALYVLSGVSQPLLVSLAKDAGLADPKCQLYMLFYYLGPASVSITFFCQDSKPTKKKHPSLLLISKAVAIAVFDIVAQTMNYTGSTLAGPTIFAIIYSSVTVWTAVFSRILLKRSMNCKQWMGVCTVFGGLTITAFHAVALGPSALLGSIIIMVGSSMHALVYVMNEAVMTRGEAKLDIKTNCAIQGLVACITLFVWQLIFTTRHYDELIRQPMLDAHTTILHAVLVLAGLSISNLLHSLSYFYTLKHFPGGATSAGVMKGLQAVLVFLVSSLLFCGRLGGAEMCFSKFKLASLFIVVGGVVLFGKATTEQQQQLAKIKTQESSSSRSNTEKGDVEVV